MPIELEGASRNVCTSDSGRPPKTKPLDQVKWLGQVAWFSGSGRSPKELVVERTSQGGDL